MRRTRSSARSACLRNSSCCPASARRRPALRASRSRRSSSCLSGSTSCKSPPSSPSLVCADSASARSLSRRSNSRRASFTSRSAIRRAPSSASARSRNSTIRVHWGPSGSGARCADARTSASLACATRSVARRRSRSSSSGSANPRSNPASSPRSADRLSRSLFCANRSFSYPRTRDRNRARSVAPMFAMTASSF